MVSNIEIKKENVLAAYETARKVGADSTMKVLEQLFGEETFKPKDVTERIKTFEDAVEALGETHPFVIQYNDIFDNFLDGAAESNSCDIVAYLKLRIIVAALNEGWEPQYTKNECRWLPWFWLYKSREEWENDMEEDWRNNHPYQELGGEYKTEYAGFASAYSSNVPSLSYANIGSRLCFKNSDLAAYCGTQFASLWLDYFLVLKSDNSINGEE